MTPQRMRVFLQDEAPRVGSGWRIITALIGRKWVKIASKKGRARLTKKQWQTIVGQGFEPVTRKRKPR